VQLISIAAAAVIIAGCAHASPGSPVATGGASSLPSSGSSHAVLIVMENKESSEVIGNGAAPYLDALARRYGFATQSYAITHPSLPNYLALTSGSTNGVSSDCTDCAVRARNIVDQFDAAGISWRAYLEDYPGGCFSGAGGGGYAKKHDPFIYYDDIAGSARRCRHLVGFSALSGDLRAGRLPTFAWITPNLCDDTHDCPVAAGDRFLAATVPALLRELGPHGFLIITWDEGSSDAGCCAGAAAGGRVATLVAGPDVRRGARERSAVDHYGVLRTIEDALRVGALGAAAQARSGSLLPLFVRRPRLR
jgi:hypothetical protein